MATSASDMRLSGGHPALDLANTVDSLRGRWGPDFLNSFDALLVLAERTAIVDGVGHIPITRESRRSPWTGADSSR